MAPYIPLRTSQTSSRSGRLSPASPSDHSPSTSLRALELTDTNAFPPPGRPNRSDTISSLGGFEFRDGLLPLTPSGEDDGMGGARNGKGEEKQVGLLQGMGLIVGTQVGSGIFSSPGVVVAEVGSVGASLMVWVMSALLAWTGASSFAELGCAIPLSGGAQAYLAYSFGPLLSYLFTWTAVSALKPGGAAIIALIFGEYVNRMTYHAFASDVEAIVPEWTFKITAICAILLVSTLNLISRSMGPSSAIFITTIKLCALVFVAILGLISLIRHGAGTDMLPANIFAGTSSQPSNYAIALYSGLWAFDGWDACCFVAGDMKDTRRDLPRALHSSMAIVLVLFFAANVSYFIVLDPATVASTNTVALDYGRVTIGRAGAVVFSILVSVSSFGALSTSFYTTAHLIHAASREHFIPKIFSRLHPHRRTPDHAMVLQASLCSFFVIFGGGFRTLLNFFSVTSWTFYLLTVLGLLVLRVKEPHLDRPYRTFFITPVVFCLVAMFLLLMPIFAAPWEALASFLFMAAGMPMYYLTAHSRAAASQKDGICEESGLSIVVRVGLAKLRCDVSRILPSKWRGVESISAERRTGRAVDEGEERLGMLRGDHLEMSER